MQHLNLFWIFRNTLHRPYNHEVKRIIVLDGPFSKLDAIQRQNVINTIPQYAPQIILFSKDDITSCFAPETIGGIWTLFSNEEKNVTVVKQGYFREVFGVDGNNN